MRKSLYSLALLHCLFASLSANTQEDIFNELAIEKNNSTANSFKKETTKIQEDNLDYLFENSKFPVDDYIYKAGGFLQPQNEDLKEEITKLDEDKKEAKPQVASQQEQNISIVKPQIDYEALKSKLEANQQRLEKQIVIDEETRRQQKIKNLIKQGILASRNGEIKEFNPNSKYGADGFSNQKSIDISTNEHKLTRMIRAGRMIPAILTTAISSDLSGVVTAQIEQDIYAAMGRAVLIPRGSKAIGFYKNDTKIGQNRLEIKWREIITPHGVNILLTDALVADNMGMTGAVGYLNNKYLERYGIAYGISTVTNALLLGIASKIEGGNNQYAQEVYSNAQSDVSTVVNDIIQQQQQIKPTIEIKSGSRIFLVPSNHMWFSKPKNNEVLMQYFLD